jgi:S1-C subfamily serine protease
MVEAIDGQPVLSAQDALARIAGRKPGSQLRLTALRGQLPFDVALEVAEAPLRADP